MSRVIGILGAAHCGSTPLGLTLGGLPGVKFVGEDHYLATLHPSPDTPLFPCGSCGNYCPVFTPGVVASAKVRAEEPQGRWWPFISHAVGSPEVVVSSDKQPRFFDRFGLPDVAIILYREQDEWAESWCNKHRCSPTVEDARWIWARIYRRARAWCRSNGVPTVETNWSAVRRNPEIGLPALADALGLEWTPEAMDWTGRHHVQGYSGIGERMMGCE